MADAANGNGFARGLIAEKGAEFIATALIGVGVGKSIHFLASLNKTAKAGGSGKVGAASPASPSIPNLTERGTLTNLFPNDPVRLRGKAKNLMVDNNGRFWLEGPQGNRTTPNGEYRFVTLPDGRIRLAKENIDNDVYSTHLGLSGGGEVSFAGSIKFAPRHSQAKGSIVYCNNASGHYKPPPSISSNACLPIELFKPGT